MPSKQTRLNSQQLTLNTYNTLVKFIQEELGNLEFFIKRRTVETYWKIGKFIHEYLLENKDRAGFGQNLCQKLSKIVDRDASTLWRMVQFYRTYPILAAQRELTWHHYKSLITVKDEKERKKIENTVIQHEWDTRKLRKYLKIKRELAVSGSENKPIAQLAFTRGRLDVRGLVNVPKEDGRGSSVRLDLGFRTRVEFPQAKALNLKDGDCVEMAQKDGDWNFQKVEVSQDEIFTYKAGVLKVIDADTLVVNIDAGCGIFVEQKLRLRGIDCPEIDTEEGQKAKRFVQARLKGLGFIVIKTHKDLTDKYARYLADVFYSKEESDPQKAAQEGQYLNQELLNERLAVLYE